MKILVIGSGGREHALAWKLSEEAEVFVTPGNPGIADDCECFDVKPDDFDGLTVLCAKLKPDLVVIGPENPLIAGLADCLRAQGLNVFGTGAEGALLEGSKSFSKHLMTEAGVPTAKFTTFTEPEEANYYVKHEYAEGRKVVVKASGVALGKGAIVCSKEEEALDAVKMMLVDKEFGEAGETVVIEQMLEGPEYSLLTICSEKGFQSLPVAQDYKRALDKDRGPNTGGMGSYSPVDFATPELVRQTEEQVVAPILRALKSKGISFKGTLFSGLMLSGGVPYCLEYNVRFGDPETQSVMGRIGRGLATSMLACALGDIMPPIEIRNNATVTVVVASEGYPGSVKKGVPIEFKPIKDRSIKIYHAGTKMVDGQYQTNGGRVLGVTATADDLETARKKAYEGVKSVEFAGMRYRKDIAK